MAETVIESPFILFSSTTGLFRPGCDGPRVGAGGSLSASRRSDRRGVDGEADEPAALSRREIGALAAQWFSV